MLPSVIISGEPNYLLNPVHEWLRSMGILFERYHALLFNFLLRLTGNRHQSEDLVQEVFVRLLKYRHTYRGESQFTTWMFQIARNAPFVDYEVELVAVIGKRGKHIPADRAAGHVFGYCVGNDVTERMWQHAGPQWSLGKSFDTHAPIGPWITTADEVRDPHTLGIRCQIGRAHV